MADGPGLEAASALPIEPIDLAHRPFTRGVFQGVRGSGGQKQLTSISGRQPVGTQDMFRSIEHTQGSTNMNHMQSLQ